MAEFQPGDTLADRFEVVGLLGRGGTATVYLAHDALRDERVAVKVLHAHLAHDPAMRRRLQREVVAAGLIRHDAALVAHDLHPIGDTLALSMPFHPGTTLTERVRADGPLSADEVRALGQRLASALADAHRRGVLHRDVTPNNVMLNAASDAVLTDFGLARTHDGSTATATSVMGTPGYAAPELYTGQRTDPRSDLYSLGAVLYFAATGRSPFGGGAPGAILHAQLSGEPEPIASVRPDLPPDLAGTIEVLLARRPEARPPGAGEVAHALAANRVAMVTEVPDTWDPEREPLLPARQALAPPLPRPVDLPSGRWEVVARGRRGCDAPTLADNLGREVGLPPGALEVTRPMRTRSKKFVLTRPTDRATAMRLAEAARTAGYRTRLYDVSPPTALQRFIVALNAVIIPLIWIAFPFFTIGALGVEMALLLSISATILIPTLTAPLMKQEPDDDLPMALSGDLARHVQGGDATVAGDDEDLDAFIDSLGLPDMLANIAHEIAADGDIREFAHNLRRGFQKPTQPSPEPIPASPAPTAEPPAPPSRAEDLRGRALGNLDLLVATLGELGDTLPDLARTDLERTAAELRDRAVSLSQVAVGLEAALASTAEPADVSWVNQRLVRLETLERGGEPVDPAERVRLQAALDSAEAAGDARDGLESRLTSTLAQLLEIGAIATRARADLLGRADVPTTARLLREQLGREVDAVDAARQELARRRGARDRR